MQWRQIGISAISLFPFSWGPWGPWFLGWYFKKYHVPYQLVPLFGWTKKSIRKHIPAQAVISYEGCWNEGETFGQMLKRIFGNDPGAIFGLLLFGAPKRAQEKTLWFRELYPEAYAVDLDGESDRDLQEVSPYNDTWRTAHRIVYDTQHSKEAGLTQKEVTSIAFVRRIRLFHLQTRNGTAWGRLLDPYDESWEPELEYLAQPHIAPIVVETMPYFFWPWPTSKLCHAIDVIRKRLERLEFLRSYDDH